jgi:hypothetical protein
LPDEECQIILCIITTAIISGVCSIDRENLLLLYYLCETENGPASGPRTRKETVMPKHNRFESNQPKETGEHSSAAHKTDVFNDVLRQPQGFSATALLETAEFTSQNQRFLEASREEGSRAAQSNALFGRGWHARAEEKRQEHGRKAGRKRAGIQAEKRDAHELSQEEKERTESTRDASTVPSTELTASKHTQPGRWRHWLKTAVMATLAVTANARETPGNDARGVEWNGPAVGRWSGQEYPWLQNQMSHARIEERSRPLLGQGDHLAERFMLRGMVNSPDSLEEKVEPFRSATSRKLLGVRKGKKDIDRQWERISGCRTQWRGFKIHSPQSKKKTKAKGWGWAERMEL